MRSDRLVQMGVAVALFGISFTKIGLGEPVTTNIAQIGTGTLYLTSLSAQDTVNHPLEDQIYIRTTTSQQESWGPYSMKPGENKPLSISVTFQNNCTVELFYLDKNNTQQKLGTHSVSLTSPSPSSLSYKLYGANYTLNYTIQQN